MKSFTLPIVTAKNLEAQLIIHDIQNNCMCDNIKCDCDDYTKCDCDNN